MSSDFDSFDDMGFTHGGPVEIDKIQREDDKNVQENVVVRIDYDLCESTGACAQVCPEDVIEFHAGHPRVNKPEACTECWICVENCTSGAIDIS